MVVRTVRFTACLRAVAAVLMAGASFVAQAQKPPALPGNFPTKPTRILIGLAAGGGIDILCRALSVKLGERWGQSVVVENRPTAGGIVAIEAVAQSAPDGYNWLASGGQLDLTVVFKRTSFDVLKVLEPMVQMTVQPYVLVVNSALPVKSVKELIALARAKPGELNYATAGPGSTAHLGHELMNIQAGVKMTHIPYKGGGAMIPDLVGGRIQLAFMPTLSAVNLINNGSVRPLGVTSLQRLDSMPDIPTVSEAGVTDYELTNNYGLYVTAKTPPALIAAINREVTQVLAAPDMKARLAADGSTAPPVHTPAQYRARVEASIARWSAVVKTSGITPDS